MKLLISSKEITAMLPPGNYDTMIPETTIIAAQSRFIKPVLGNRLYDAIEAGKYNDLTEQLLKPALAMYAYYLAIPSIAFRTGNLGVVRFKSDYYSPADHEAILRLRKAVRSEAESGMQLLVEHIETNIDMFPEYDRAQNIKHRISITGGLVL